MTATAVTVIYNDELSPLAGNSVTSLRQLRQRIETVFPHVPEGYEIECNDQILRSDGEWWQLVYSDEPIRLFVVSPRQPRPSTDSTDSCDIVPVVDDAEEAAALRAQRQQLDVITIIGDDDDHGIDVNDDNTDTGLVINYQPMVNTRPTLNPPARAAPATPAAAAAPRKGRPSTPPNWYSPQRRRGSRASIADPLLERHGPAFCVATLPCQLAAAAVFGVGWLLSAPIMCVQSALGHEGTICHEPETGELRAVQACCLSPTGFALMGKPWQRCSNSRFGAPCCAVLVCCYVCGVSNCEILEEHGD